MNPARHGPVPLPREHAGGFEDAMRARAEARAFLVGMQRAALHAADDPFGAGAPLQAMRVIMVLPGAGSGTVAMRRERQRVALPVLPGTYGAGLRPVGGELLRDACGRLYERSGAGLRALGSVVAGPDGRLYERFEEALAPAGGGDPGDATEAPRDAVDTSTADAAPDFDDDGFSRAEDEEDPGDERAEAAPRAPAPARERAARTRRRAPAAAATAESTADPCPVRALLPAPGKWVQLRYGDFATLLRSQLAAPERMAADYEIGAYLQVFDSSRAIAPEEAAHWVFGDAQQALAFGMWNAGLARRLGVSLGGQDARRRAAPDPQAGGIGAGQRFFALRIVSDPTAGMNAAPATAAPAAAVAPRPNADAPRRAVPAALLCAVAPTRTRDQAIAAMQQPPGTGAWWRRLLRAGRVSRAARRDWQQRLAGRSLDEQLWAVAPPPHGLGDSALREWAQRALRLGGYELPRMADEWEIFWRCRGATD